MKIILFGSTGMVGQGVLRECLLDSNVTEIITVVRKSTGETNPKLREIVHKDFLDFSSIEAQLSDADACYFCLGVSSAGMSEADYTRITYDMPMAAAKVLVSPKLTFIYVSGTGADRNVMWARVKRKAEEGLIGMPFKAVYIFRPGFIQPLHGIKSRTRMYNLLYPLLYPVMLAMKFLAPKHITDTERLGQAMLRVTRNGFPKHVLENPDINIASTS